MSGGAGRHAEARQLRAFSRALAEVPTRQGRFERWLRAVARSWCRAVGWRLDVARTTPLPQRDGVAGAGCLVVAAPHRAWLEPFLLAMAWPPDAARLIWLADARAAVRSWWRRLLLPRLGVIPVTPAAGDPRAYAQLVTEVCARGHAVVVFPEVGPPSPPCQLRRVSPGFAYLAIAADAPVVPVVIGGTHRIVRGSRFTLDFLPALEARGPADAFTSAGRAEARALTGRYLEQVAEVLPERTSRADATAPERERWRWLGSLFD